MPTEIRKSTAISLTINFENAVMPAQFRRPVLTTVEQILVDGVAVEQAQHLQRPILQADVTDEMIAAVNAQLALVGLVVTRTASDAEASNA
ncbi:hypothetical protein P3T40_002002 [Paraburkholderia sp. EB58]|jgi:hypothetical protein|uniref:hypothetical protein n=1 Tax=Paraburkholderia sp. EB58 TaxID=3035125 RepID=UPI003D1EB855